jgi:hypothetical protein
MSEVWVVKKSHGENIKGQKNSRKLGGGTFLYPDSDLGISFYSQDIKEWVEEWLDVKAN